MSLTSFSSPSSSILVQKSGPALKIKTRNFMLKYTQFPLMKAQTFQVRSSFQNKVFENKSEGIICYRDESGEIICEGFDEGPRFHQQLPRTPYNSRDAEIINLLQQRLIEVVNSDNGAIPVKEDFDFKWNGINNKLC